jgi:hypothetical protein
MKTDNWFQQAGKEEALHEGRKSFMGDPDCFCGLARQGNSYVAD